MKTLTKNSKISNKTVLVTGAGGFIGSHLVEELARRGYNVRALCQYNSRGSLGWLDSLDPELGSRVNCVLGDIRDREFVQEICAGVSTVFHLAALISIPYSYQAPDSFVQTNVLGTMNVLNAARSHRCDRVVQTSTSEVYGTPSTLPIVETHPLQGQSPYSASKIAADKMCESYHRSFNLPVVTLRPFNTFGPRQSTRAVLPTILTQLLAGKEEIALGRLDTRRDLTFVKDTVRGFVLAGETPGIEGETVQLGTGRAVSIQELFNLACQVTDRKARVVCEPERMRPDASEVLVLQSSPEKAQTLLGWKAETSLEAGVSQTAQWLEERWALYVPGRRYA